MPFDITNPATLTGAAAAVRVTNPDFLARIALGVRNKPRNGTTTWVILVASGGGCAVEHVGPLKSDELPEDHFRTDVAISATSDTWATVRADEDFLAAVGVQRFFVTGETPFFIRHLASVLEVVKPFR